MMVKRYEPDKKECIGPSGEGRFVFHSEYEKLEARCNDLEEQLNGIFKEFQDEGDGESTNYGFGVGQRIKQKIEKLEAENRHLRAKLVGDERALSFVSASLQLKRDELIRIRDVIDAHKRDDVWYWQDDGENHIESMSNGMVVIIRADQLKNIKSSNEQQTKYVENIKFRAERAEKELGETLKHKNMLNAVLNEDVTSLTARLLQTEAELTSLREELTKEKHCHAAWLSHAKAFKNDYDELMSAYGKVCDELVDAQQELKLEDQRIVDLMRQINEQGHELQALREAVPGDVNEEIEQFENALIRFCHNQQGVDETQHAKKKLKTLIGSLISRSKEKAYSDGAKDYGYYIESELAQAAKEYALKKVGEG